MLHLTNFTLKRCFLCFLIGIAVLSYIFLSLSSYTEPTFFIPSDSGEVENLLENTKESISRDRIRMILNLKKQLKKLNTRQKVQNLHLGREISMIIVIEVTDKKDYLEQLVDSLKNATGIAKTLLIFSHGHFDKEINVLVRNTTFAKVMQVFYPYSVQLHPLVFPGNDNKICDDLIRCQNGNRNPLVMQAKHHWWWTSEFVFKDIRYVKNYNGSVLFLDEDQYVTQDFIFILKVLERLVSTSYPNCDVITLGGNSRNVSQYNREHATVTLKPLGPSDSGVVINRYLWDTIRSSSEHYCRYNDSRWINSLNYLARQSSTGNFLVMSIDSPRVFRLSDCININGNKCHVVESVEKINSFIERISINLYPQNLVIREIIDEEIIVPDGKWRDARDQELCLYFTKNLKKSHVLA